MEVTGSHWRGIGWALALVLLTVVAYQPAVQGGFIWDDDDYVRDNHNLRSLEGLGRIWFELGATRQYYPAVHTTFWLEYHLWELDTRGYHLVNILLHGLGAVLLWQALRRLAVPGAWAAAAVFALHPVHVESVAWITERKNVLSGVFYLGAAWAYVCWALEGYSRRWLYGLSLVLFIGALLSKTVTCSLPPALMLVLWWKKGRLGLEDWRRLAPFFALGIGLGLLTLWMEKTSVGAWGDEWTLSLAERFVVAGRALWFYAAKLVWPMPLSFVYPRWQLNTAAWQYLYPLLAAAVIGALWLGRQWLGRGPLAAVLFFVGTLFPALGFFAVYPMRYSYVADHFQYLASVGLIVLAMAAGYRSGLARSMWSNLLIAVAIVVLGVFTWRQAHNYQDLETLWRDTIRKNPQAWLAHNNLGTVVKRQGRLDEALNHYRRAGQLKPDAARIQVNIGDVLAGLRRDDEAYGFYLKALELDPTYLKAYVNMGNLLYGQQRLDEALTYYRRAVELNPYFAEAHNNLGSALIKKGQLRPALVHYRRAVEINPKFASAHQNLAVALKAAGQLVEARRHLRLARQLRAQ
jgi:tetratricopeptide (TPR) repeat protein